MSLELTAKTEPGSRLVDARRGARGRDRPAGRRPRPRRELPLRELRRRQAERVLDRSDPGGARRSRRHLRARRARRLEPARPRRRIADPGREHAPRLRAERRSPLADRDRSRRRATRRGRSPRRSSRSLDDGTVFASAGSELGQDLTRPATTATRTEDGWIVSGHKIFCTMSPAADVLYTAVTYTDDGGS